METRPTTISKVIAFELGLLIAVLTWIAFAGVPGMKPRAVAKAEEPPDASFANVSPLYHANGTIPINTGLPLWHHFILGAVCALLAVVAVRLFERRDVVS